MFALKFAAVMAFIMSPFGVVGLRAQIHHWNDMQVTGAMMMACVFSPLLMGLAMTVFPNGFDK